MDDKKYELRFLPLFEDDLNEIVDHISNKLKNPNAAIELVNEVENAILKRLSYPESFEPYRSAKKRKDIYYVIRVKNYMVFYVVIGNVMEVRRVLYNKRDLPKMI